MNLRVEREKKKVIEDTSSPKTLHAPPQVEERFDVLPTPL